MTIGLVWWLLLLGGTAAAIALARRRPQDAAGVAVGTFAVLVVAVAGSAPAPAGGEPVARPLVAAVAERPPAPGPVPAAERRRPAPPAPLAPARLVRAYYAALDRGDHRSAWRRLDPAIRQRFGGFAAWRAGYATTLSHRVEALRTAGGAATHVLVAVDRTPCGGTTTRRFAVAWRFERGRAAALSARKLAGAEPLAAC